MCGRYSILAEETEEDENIELHAILREVELNFGAAAVKTGEIFPTDIAPVLAVTENRIAPRPVKWGFPHWKPGAGVIINARAETALEKSMFRQALLSRRCVIPSTGFYEWQHMEGKKKKDKYRLLLCHETALYMAGMAAAFKDADGHEYEAFVILTTAANESVAPIHDRMPVILSPAETASWIRDDGFMKETLQRGGPKLNLTLV